MRYDEAATKRQDLCTAHPIPVREARFRWHGPRDPSPFERFFGGPVRFGAREDALLLDRKVFRLALPENAPELVQKFEKYAAAIIQKMQAEPDFADSVRTALSEGILNGRARQQDIARQLGIAVRILNRRLTDVHTSFHEMRDDLLRDAPRCFCVKAICPLRRSRICSDTRNRRTFTAHFVAGRAEHLPNGGWRLCEGGEGLA